MRSRVPRPSSAWAGFFPVSPANEDRCWRIESQVLRPTKAPREFNSQHAFPVGVVGLQVSVGGTVTSDPQDEFFGGGYVAMAIEDLRLPPEKVDTIADFDAVKRFGVQSKGGADAATASVVAELADLVAQGELEVPIAAVFALDDVREAYRQLELRHTPGKIVLRP